MSTKKQLLHAGLGTTKLRITYIQGIALHGIKLL